MISIQEVIIRLLTAALLGSVVGFERERLDWAAGLRTHMLVCLGSALAIIISAFGFGDIIGAPAVVLDPSRIAAQVISGIGFLGAGIILFLRQQIVRGLTTAAGLWAVAAIGLAVGSGMYAAGLIATVIVVLILAGLKPLERHIFRKKGPGELIVRVARDRFDIKDIEEILFGTANGYVSLTILPDQTKSEDLLRIKLVGRLETNKTADLLNRLRRCSGVKEISTGKAMPV